MARRRFADNTKRITDLIVQLQIETDELGRVKDVDPGLVQDARKLISVLCDAPSGGSGMVMSELPADIDHVKSFSAQWSSSPHGVNIVRTADVLLKELKKLGKLWSESRESTRQQMVENAHPGKAMARWVLYWIMLGVTGSFVYILVNEVYLKP